MSLSIRQKVFFGLFGVVAVVTTITYFVMQYLLLDLSRQEVSNSLDNALISYQHFDEQRSELLMAHAASIAQTPHLKAILSIPDVDSATVFSIADGLENIGPNDLRLIINTDGRLLADLNDAESVLTDLSNQPGVNDALTGRDYVGNWQYKGDFYKVAVKPSIGNSKLLGVLVVGELLASPEYINLAEQVGGAEAVIVLGKEWFPSDSIRSEIASDFLFAIERERNSATTRQITGQDHKEIVETFIDTHRYYTTSLQLNDLPGSVIFYRNGDLVDASIVRILWLMIICSVVALGLGFLLSLWISQRISAPIVSLTQAAREFGKGNYNSRVETQTRNEFGVLNKAFNEMAEYIKNSRQQLVESVDAAQAANHAKSEFLARMSHEIRTPMNAILGFTELVLTSEIQDSKQRSYIEMIHESGQSLLNLINDILDFAKIEAGKLTLDTSSFDLYNVANSSIEMFSKDALDKNIELICNIAPDIHPNVLGDSNRLRQVLVNLIGNAIKFTEAGEVELLVRKTGNGLDVQNLRFEVRDTGIGIASENLDMVFESFEQEDSSTTRHYGGTGLGLSISKQLVELMGGKIGIENTSSTGTVFWFTIPMPLVESDLATDDHNLFMQEVV